MRFDKRKEEYNELSSGPQKVMSKSLSRIYEHDLS